MKRRIIIASLAALAVGGGFAGHASASQPESSRHTLCLFGPTPQAPNQEGICITWVDPVAPKN